MISQRAQGIQPSGIRKMFERAAQLQDPVDFSIGQPHFDVPEALREAAVAAMRAGKNRYTVTQGIPELNAAIRRHVNEHSGRDPEQTMVTTGVSGGLLLSFLTLLDPGDEVLLPDPFFVLYKVAVELVGGVARHYDMYPDFRLTRASLEAAVTDKTKVLLLNSPCNPTGSVLSEEELRIAADFAKEHGLVLIADEIYEAFCYDGPCPSAAAVAPDALVLGGFSKSYGMPGWRLGYASGPAAILDVMTTIQQFTFVCAHTPSQHAVVEAFELDLAPFVSEYRSKRDRLCEALAGHYDLVRPGGSFYAFPSLPEGVTGADFAEQAFGRQMLLVPGRAFSSRDTNFRLSYAVPDETLERGLRELQALSGKSV
jgi:aspartate aminotransferase/aminotransferase